MRFTPSTLLLCIVLLLSCIVHVQAAPDAGNSVDPEAHVDYVINFDENLVKKEEMDMVADWLKQRNIEIKETELASYAAYQVATLNRKLGIILVNASISLISPLTS